MKNKIDKSLILLLSFFFISSNLTAMENISPVGHCLDDLEENKMDYEIQEELEPEKDFPEVFFRSAQNNLEQSLNKEQDLPIFFSSLTGDKYSIPRSIIAKAPNPLNAIFSKESPFQPTDNSSIEIELPSDLTKILSGLVIAKYIEEIAKQDVAKLLAENNMQAILDLYIYADGYLNINLPILAKPIIKYIYEKFGDKEEIENYIKENFNSPEAKITLAKEYFYQYGKVNQDIQRAIGIEERKKQFLNIGYDYGFSIEELLQNNKIPPIIKTNYSEDKELNLHYLKIDSLTGLEQIPEIDSVNNLGLSYNQLTKIESNSFVSLGNNLKKLYLIGNKIKKIEEDGFKGLKSLETLNLYSNQISKFEHNVFNSLTKLEILDMTDNNIESFKPSLFKNLKNLRWLDLMSNKLKIIKDNSFEGLKNLEQLTLGINKIQEIELDGFNGLSKLRNLELDVNNINNLSVDILKPLHQLQRLAYAGTTSPELLNYLKSRRIGFYNGEKFFNNE